MHIAHGGSPKNAMLSFQLEITINDLINAGINVFKGTSLVIVHWNIKVPPYIGISNDRVSYFILIYILYNCIILYTFNQNTKQHRELAISVTCEAPVLISSLWISFSSEWNTVLESLLPCASVGRCSLTCRTCLVSAPEFSTGIGPNEKWGYEMKNKYTY